MRPGEQTALVHLGAQPYDRFDAKTKERKRLLRRDNCNTPV
jgi:hypothetical protein